MYRLQRSTPHRGVPGGWMLGRFIRLGYNSIVSPILPVHGHPPGVNLPVLVVNFDEQPLSAFATGGCRTLCFSPGAKRNKESHQLSERTILVSDSQTCLSLCSKPSATLDLFTSLIVSRVQDLWAPHMDNLFYAPGEKFHQNER